MSIKFVQVYEELLKILSGGVWKKNKSRNERTYEELEGIDHGS